jgi:hypothetical protein
VRVIASAAPKKDFQVQAECYSVIVFVESSGKFSHLWRKKVSRSYKLFL